MTTEIQKAIDNTPITKETIKQYLCPTATDQDLTLILNICHQSGMNPFVGDVNIIKYDQSKPAQIVVRKDWFFKVANSQPDYEGMDHGIIVERNGEIVYQNGAFKLKSDTLVGGWSVVHRKNKRPYRSEVSFDEYSKNQSTWKTMPATMINKVAKVHGLRESFPEKFEGIYDESEFASIKSNSPQKAMSSLDRDIVSDQNKTVIDVPSKPLDTPIEVPKTSDDINCSKCDVSINKEVNDYSLKFFNLSLCRDCQKIAKSEEIKHETD